MNEIKETFSQDIGIPKTSRRKNMAEKEELVVS
jgi:hypothetical protein